MKASITAQGEVGVCLSAAWRHAAQGQSGEGLEGKDKQLMLDKAEQGEPSVRIQKKASCTQRSHVRKSSSSKHLKG